MDIYGVHFLNEYLEFSKEWLAECNRLLKPNGSIYIFMGIRYISYIYHILEDDLGLFFSCRQHCIRVTDGAKRSKI